MTHILRNLRGLWRNERLLLAIMVLCVFSSALLLQFAYGLYQNYHVQRTEADSELKTVIMWAGKPDGSNYASGEHPDGSPFTAGDLRHFVEALPDEITDHVDVFVAYGNPGKLSDHIEITEDVRKAFDETFGGMVIYTTMGEDGREGISYTTFDGTPTEAEIEADIAQFNETMRSTITDWSLITIDSPILDYGDAWDFGFIYRNGQYLYPEIRREVQKMQGDILSGEVFTNAQFATGEHVVAVCDNWFVNSNPKDETLRKLLQPDGNPDTIYLWGEPYRIIARSTFHLFNFPTPPFTVAPDSVEMCNLVLITFETNINRKTFEQLKTVAEETNPGLFSFEDMAFPDNESIYLYNNIMLISALIAVLSVLNFVMLYHFILQRRSRALAICRLTGCTAGRAMRMYLGECFSISIPVYLLGLAVFIPLMKRILSGIFPYMEDAYSIWVYAAIFGIYIGVMLLMLTVMVTRHVRQAIRVQMHG